MEQLQALKQTESNLSLVSDHVSVMSSKLEDLLFRAQRIAAATKDNPKALVNDSMFGYDLQSFRRDVRAFGNETGGLVVSLNSVERMAQFDEECIKHAQAVMRLADRMNKALAALMDQAVLAHSYIRAADHKVEAWYMIQEIEAVLQQTQSLPTVANKVLIAVSTKKPGWKPAAPPASAATPPASPAAPAAAPAPAPEPRRGSIPLRSAGQLNPRPPSGGTPGTPQP